MLTINDKPVFIGTGKENLFAIKTNSVQETAYQPMKNVEVFVDLLGYGTVILTVDYSLAFADASPRSCTVACRISLIDRELHGWLYSPDFKLIFSEIGLGKGHMVCFSGEGINKNVYYQTMLNVVSDYIFLKEKFFI